MKHWLPQPGLSLLLALVWLALHNTLAPDHILLGALLGVLIPALVAPLWPDAAPGRARHPLLALRLLITVLGDIVVASLDVARRILGRESAIRPAFIQVPLELRNPWGVAILSGIITMTPGTLSAELSADGRTLLVHAFNPVDPAAVARDIKSRYEAPLMQIFA